LGAACEGGSGEPEGLSATTAATDSPEGEETTADPTGDPTSSPTSEATDESEPAATAEPEPTFTQPYVPGDPSVIALPEELPVETSGSLAAAEQDVVDALGHAMASWDAMLFAADPGEVGIDTWFSGDLLTSLNEYAAESHAIERVNVGSPTRVVVHDITVDEPGATVDVCLYTEDWVEYVGGAEGEPVDPVNAYRMPAVLNDDGWRFTNSTTVELDCS